MIVAIVHGFAHRILNNGLMQSAPVISEGDEIVIGEFDFHAAEEMQLGGGDEELIRSTLERFASVFPADYKLPHAEKIETKESHVVAPV
jgi:hypothetical protein